MNKADRIRLSRKKKQPLCSKAVLQDIRHQKDDREWLTFEFRLENGQKVYRNAPPLLSSESVTWKIISGILGTDLALDYRQWIKARNLKDLVGRSVLVRLAKKINANGTVYTHVEEVYPA
tara:strand:+ start:175 stop:534 length:360 start_codon:yes stop_codon:yes gene_type:complete